MNKLKLYQIGSETEDGISYRYIIGTNDELIERRLRVNEFIDDDVDILSAANLNSAEDVELLIPANDLAVSGTISDGYVFLKTEKTREFGLSK